MSLIENEEGVFPEVHLGHHWWPSIAPPVNVHPFPVPVVEEGNGTAKGVVGE